LGSLLKIDTREVAGMGVSDPELREKLFGPRWVQLQHESEKQRWPRWKRLIHRLQRCPICKPSKKEEQ
jgi:hypothetical protein